MKTRVKDENIFVTRIKENTKYESIRELELPEDKDHNILKDEIIRLNSLSADKSQISQIELRRVAVFDEISGRTIGIITNQLEWKASTIAALYKKR